MKKTFMIGLFIIFSVLIYAAPTVRFTLRDAFWSAEFELPLFFDSLGLNISLFSGNPYLGVYYHDSWEEYSTGFFKIKVKDGNLFFGIIASDTGDFCAYGRLVSNSYKAPLFSHSYNEVYLFSNGGYRSYSRVNLRMPIGAFNTGVRVINRSDNNSKFWDSELYFFAKDFSRSFRLFLTESWVQLTLDIETIDSLGELGYGAGIGASIAEFSPGIALYLNRLVKIGTTNLTVSAKMFIGLDEVKTHLLVSNLGNRELFALGIGLNNLDVVTMFVRFIY
ncbi:hypothetical protein [Kosmotoga sp.]|uniref:hypothetical protein n=1 Tax=Kosmotoga sp. TaxID=1955248 RepID=UPI0024AB01B7|nr:hypothetical protein [Kosmotoga sp.]MDI3524021.1 hypothetical protein [Kosmotoga sp.]